MIKIIFECDECGSQYKTEVIDIYEEVINYIPEDWYILNEDMVDEKLICQDCVSESKELQKYL